MSEDLKIILTPSADTSVQAANRLNRDIKQLQNKVNALNIKSEIDISKSSASEINKQISTLQKQIKPLKLYIELDQRVLKTLDNFSKSIEDQIKAAKQLNKTIEEQTTITKKLDGSTEKTTRQYKQNGEIIQKTTKHVNEQTQALQKQAQAAKVAQEQITKYGQTMSKTTKTDAPGNILGRTQKNQQSFRDITYNEDGQGNVDSIRITDNIEKRRKAIKRLETQLRTLKQQGEVSAVTLNRMSNAIDVADTVQDIEKIQNRLTQLDDASRARQRTRELEKQLELYKRQAAINVQGLQSRFGANLGNEAQNLQKYVDSVNALSARNPDVLNQMKSANMQYKELAANASFAASQTQTLGNELKNAFSRVAIYGAAFSALYGGLAGLQNITQQIVEIDTAMTDLRRVMDIPNSSFNDLLQDSIDLSTELGNKVSDVLSITNEFGRLGYEGDQLIDLTETAQVLQNISDLNPDDTVKSLTAAMTSFNIAAEDSGRIADLLNEVDNNYSVSTMDLAQSIRRAGSTAKTFGVDLEQLVGYTTAISASTRESGNITGTALKTIISRITTLGAAKEQLDDVGISINDMAGNVRPAAEIFEELGGKWHSLTDAQRQNIAVAAAGRQQLSRFLAMMENFGMAQEATNTAVNSFGSAAKEQERFADSLSARIAKLQNKWTELSVVLGEAFLSDGIIAFTEAAGDGLELLSGFANAVGMLPPLFAAASVAVIAFSKNARLLATAMVMGTGALNDQERAFMNYEKGASRATVAANTFKNATRGLLTATGVGAVFAGIGFAVEKLTTAYANAQARQEEFETAQKKSIESLGSEQSTIDSLVKSYEHLSSIDRNNDQEEEYLRIQNELATLLPSVKAGEDEKGNSILYNSSLIKEKISLLEKEAELERAQAEREAPGILSDNANDIERARKKIAEYEKEMEDLQQFIEKHSDDNMMRQQVQGSQDRIDALSANINGKFDKMNDKMVASAEAIATITSNIEGLSTADLEWISDQALDNGYKSEKQVAELAKRVADLKKELGEGFDLKGLNADQLDAIAKVAQSTDGIKEGTKAYSEQVNKLSELGVKKAEADQIVGTLIGKYEKQKAVTQEAAQSYEEEESALEGVNEEKEQSITLAEQLSGVSKASIDSVREQIAIYSVLSQKEKLSTDEKAMLADATAKLTAMYPHLAKGSNLRIDAMQKEAERSDILLQAGDKLVSGQLSQEEQMTYAAAAHGNSRLKILQDMVQRYEDAANRMNAMAEESRRINGDNADAANAEITAWKFGKQAIKAQEELKQGYEDIMPEIESYTSALADVVDYNGEYYKSTENAKKAEEEKQKEIESSRYVLDKYKEELDKVNLQIEKQNNLLNDYPGHSKKYRDAVKSEIKMLKEKKKILQDQAKTMEQQIKSGYINPTGIVTSSSTGGSVSGGLGYSPLSSSVGGKYADYINQAASKYGVDANLIAAIIKQESGFNPNARSHAGAQGLMQLMPGTAKDLGVKNAYDPQQNIMGGTKYIADQLKKFGGDVQKALYAYNAGAGNVSKILSSAQGQWKEPKNYADKVLANYSNYAGSVVTQTTNAAKSVADYYKNNFRQTSDYMENRGTYKHKGIDLANGKQGDPVKSLQSGKVITANYSKSAGYWVVVQQDDGTVAKYMHMQKGLDVKAGQRVDSGQKLGKVGNTGQSSGAHLHLQIEDASGKTINPNTYLDGLTDYSSTVAQNASNVANARSEVLGIQSEIAGIDEQIEQLNYDIVESYLAGYDKRINDLDVNLAKYESQLVKYDETSSKWRDVTGKQLNDTVRQKNIQAEKVRFIEREMKANKAFTAAQRDQLSQELNNAKISLYDFEQQIFQLEQSIMSSKVEEKIEKIAEAYEKLTDKFEDLGDKISMTEEEKDQVKYYSNQYKNLLQQQKAVKDYIKQLKEQQKAVKSFPDLYKQIGDEISNWEDKQKHLTLEVYNTRHAIETIYKNMSDEVVDIYKEMYEKMRDIELENAEKATKKIIDEIDDKADDEKFNKELEKRNKELQVMQDKYGKLSFDDSEWAKSERNDLKIQIEEAQESLADFLSDRADEKRKEALNDQLEKDNEEINRKFDNLINDEREFDSIEEKILNGQISNVTKQLSSFSGFVKDNMDSIGQSISENLVDRLKEASQALNVIVSGNTTGKKVSSFDTGGYTGKWGSKGKLAMLHEKELVLNENDTVNFLQAIEASRKVFNVNTPLAPNKSVVNNNDSSENNFYINMYNTITSNENPGDKISRTLIKEMSNRGMNWRA